VIGAVLGALMGNAVGVFIFQVEGLVLPVAPFVLAFTACTIVGLLSGFLPAIKAARLDPIEALRYE
jgi:putative ABC transport system permease protein